MARQLGPDHTCHEIIVFYSSSILVNGPRLLVAGLPVAGAGRVHNVYARQT
jgi:hypothetical protein